MSVELNTKVLGDHNPMPTVGQTQQGLLNQQMEGGDETGVSVANGNDTIPPPDGGWGWIVVVGSFLVHVLTDGITYSFGVFMPDIVDDFGVSRQTVGWLNSLLVGVTFVSGELSFSFIPCHPNIQVNPKVLNGNAMRHSHEINKQIKQIVKKICVLLQPHFTFTVNSSRLSLSCFMWVIFNALPFSLSKPFVPNRIKSAYS